MFIYMNWPQTVLELLQNSHSDFHNLQYLITASSVKIDSQVKTDYSFLIEETG